MKKLLMSALCTFTLMTTLSAQKINDIIKQINSNDFAKAKEQVDLFLANPKNADKAEGWYFKGRAYNGLSNTTNIEPAEALNLKNVAYEAFLKTQELDPKDVRLKMEGYQSYLNLYLGYFDLGAKFFNEKNYDNSFASFKQALKVKDYALSKDYTYDGITLNPLDTSLVLNTAVAAMQAKKTDEALTYYRQLTDAEVAGPNYLDIYLYLADHYKTQKDMDNLNFILEKGKKLYPENGFWSQTELDLIRESGDQAALFAQYEKSLAEKPNDFINNYNYAIELFNAVYGQEERPADIPAAKEKITQLLTTAIGLDEGIDATVLMSNHFYNMAADESDAITAIKGNKPEDVANKKAARERMMKYLDQCIPYADAVVKYYDSQTEKLTGLQKANQRIAINHLSDIYSTKGDDKKAAEYDAKKKDL